jgi:hypothetical protein
VNGIQIQLFRRRGGRIFFEIKTSKHWISVLSTESYKHVQYKVFKSLGDSGCPGILHKSKN